MQHDQAKRARREDAKLRSRANEYLVRLSEMEEAICNPVEEKHGFNADTLALFAENFFLSQLKWYGDEAEIVLRRPHLPAATRMLYQGLRAEVRRLRPLVVAVVDSGRPLRHPEQVTSH